MKNNIYFVGLPAAGKSTIGKQLAKTLKFKWIDTDQEIVRRTGVEINWIFDQEGEEGFRQRERTLIEELTQEKDIVLSTGGETILDPKNRQLLHDTGIVIYLQVSITKQVERTEKDKVRPLLRSGDKKQKLMELSERLNSLYASIADITIATDSSAVPLLVGNLQKKIVEWKKSKDLGA